MTTITYAKARKILHETKYRSKLERDFALHLAVEEGIATYYEPFRLRLANGAYYKPDFMVINPDRTMTIFEVKGHFREAAKVRVKVAASLHPYFRFIVVTRSEGVWHLEEFKP